MIRYRWCAGACGSIIPAIGSRLCRGCHEAGVLTPKLAVIYTRPPAPGMDPGREGRLAEYAERAAAEAPLFTGRGG